MSHTPGPWDVSPERIPSEPSHRFVDAGLRSIADVHGHGNAGETVANARLIAAAPDLLAALKDIPLLAEWDSLPLAIREAVSAAIARATGADA